MKLVRPALLSGAAIISTNAVESATVYSSGTTYALGARVYEGRVFDFTGGSLPTGATLTRSTTAYYWNSSGVLATAAINAARFDYDPVTHVSKGLLIEPAATNLLTRSQALDHADWQVQGGANPRVADAIASPDGTTNADLIKSWSGTGNQHIAQSPTTTLATYTLSLFAKAKEYSKFGLLAAANATFPFAVFDLAAGTAAQFGSAISAISIQDVGGGWFRGQISFPAQAASTQQHAFFPAISNSYSFAGDGTSGLYFWQAQLELGSGASSPILTTGSSATRAADALVLNWGAKGVPNGTCTVRYTFDDGSTQDVSTVVSGGTAAVPTNLNRSWIKTAAVVGMADGVRIYESAQASNTGHSLTDPAWWFDVGPTNRTAMFDDVNGTSTYGATGLDVTVQPVGRIDTVALLNVDAATARIVVTDATAGTILDATYALTTDAGVTDWYAYFYEPIIRKTDLIVTGIALYSGPTIRVVLAAGGGPVSVGSEIVGQAKYIGSTETGASIGITDYSRKEADDFGVYQLVERAYSRKGSYRLMVDSSTVDEVVRLLAEYRATPILYIGSDVFSSAAIFGFYRDFNMEVDYGSVSFCSLEIEGLT